MSVGFGRAVGIVAVLAVLVGLCIAGLRCGGTPRVASVERIRSEMEAGRREYRTLQADELAALARDMRVLAQRYLEQGEKMKAQRAIGAAQELDKKILELRGEQ